MGYFPNGTSGDLYQEHICERCRHHPDHDDLEQPSCAVWFAHMERNYKDCNNPDSPLHILIPRNAKGENERCRMFIAKPDAPLFEASSGERTDADQG